MLKLFIVLNFLFFSCAHIENEAHRSIASTREELYSEGKLKFLKLSTYFELTEEFQNITSDDDYKLISFTRIPIGTIAPEHFIDQEKIPANDYWFIIDQLTQISTAKNLTENQFNTRNFIGSILAPLINYKREILNINLEDTHFVNEQKEYLVGLKSILTSSLSDNEKMDQVLYFKSKWVKDSTHQNILDFIQRNFSTTFEQPRALFGDNISQQSQKIIRSATKSLDISVSFLRGEGAISSIETALDNGATVRLILDERNLQKGDKEKKLFMEFQKRFEGKKIEMAYLSPARLQEFYGEWYPIYHRKIISVDGGKIVVISSDNLDAHQNIDSSLVFENQENTHLTDLFEKDWKIATHQIQNAESIRPPLNIKLFGKGLQTDDLRSEIKDQIEKAKERVWLSIFELNDDEIVEKIIEKKKQNPEVDIKILICWSKLSVWFNGKKYEKDRHLGVIKKLESNGISIKIFPEKSNMRLHARVLITDNHIISGSSDYTPRALNRNLDLTVSTEMRTQDVPEIEKTFLNLWAKSNAPKKSTLKEFINEKISQNVESLVAMIYKKFHHPSPDSNPIIRLGDYDQVVLQSESELKTLVKEYQEKHQHFAQLDFNDPHFESQISELKNLEDKLDTHIKTELDSLARAQNDFAINISLHNQEFSNDAKNIQALYLAYKKHTIEYGGPKDYRRYAAFTELYFQTKALYEKINKVNNPQLSNLITLLKHIIFKMKTYIELSFQLALPSLQMLNSAYQEFTHTKIGFGKSVDLFFKRWGDISKINTEVQGKEWLEGQKRIRLYVPTHRDANLDAVAFAALDVDNPVVFGALNLKNHPIFGMKDNPLVKLLIQKLESNNTFILAGSTEKPIDKFIRLIKEKKAKNALIYPEGQISLGIKESRPVRENFSVALITRLIEEKIDFELVPVTYVNGAQYFEYHNDFDFIKSEEKKLLIRIQRPITVNEISSFFDKYGPRLFNTYLRFKWLFSMEQNQTEVLGQGSWEAIKNSFYKKMNGVGPSCQSSIEKFFN